VDVDTYISAVATDGLALIEAARSAGPAARIPDCPGWTVAALLEHLGLVNRWATGFVRDRLPGGFTDREPMPAGADPLDWYAAGHAALVGALRAAPADLSCWTFLPGRTPLEFWARRQAHETAVHRADVQAAAGAPRPFDPEFAADGVDELIGTLLGLRGGRFVSSPPRSLVVRASDVPASWRIDLLPDRRAIGPDEGAPASCVITGSAADLYLFLWNREPAVPPVVTGDGSLAELWRATVRMRR
jgi:uncharacterized protein (TIGR03083 family)